MIDNGGYFLLYILVFLAGIAIAHEAFVSVPNMECAEQRNVYKCERMSVPITVTGISDE